MNAVHFKNFTSSTALVSDVCSLDNFDKDLEYVV